MNYCFLPSVSFGGISILFNFSAFGDFIFLAPKKMKRAGYNWPFLRPVQKRAPLRGACTAQIVFVVVSQAVAFGVGCHKNVLCETDSRAVRVRQITNEGCHCGMILSRNPEGFCHYWRCSVTPLILNSNYSMSSFYSNSRP